MKPSLLYLSLALTVPVGVFAARRVPAAPPAPVVGDSRAYVSEVLRMAQRTVLGLRSCARGVNTAHPGTLAHAQSFTITVARDGSVEDLVIAPADPVTARLRGCLVPVVRRWSLRPPSARMTLSYSMAELRSAFGTFHFE